MRQVVDRSSSDHEKVVRGETPNSVDAYQAVNHHLPVKASVAMDAVIGTAAAVTTVVNYYYYPGCPGPASNEMMHLLGFPKAGISYRLTLVGHMANL